MEVRHLADKNFQLLKNNPSHPSLQFKKVGKVWSARIGSNYRAISTEIQDGFLWFWIGTHAEYDKLLY
ncbi:type II toxin-antitoxin system HigB family toxin [Synechococcus sp. PCC 7502]|uniref:type II toxin-antitoxin system HigB family toxin n=1 Tax=Synechococcus sp. PCC 7502 TaxID=1173263 RepID=UPI001FED3C5C|nr:type II toxin-antitoxin system HigB family toxin [Synechococcus sp. PCC 7502]